jgi:exosortase
MNRATLAARLRPLAPLWPLAVCLLCVCWAFLTILTELWTVWGSNPQYSHGYLVPLFAAYLLYARREHLRPSKMEPSLFGAGLLALGIGMRLYGTYYHYTWVDQISILPILAGAWWMVGGFGILRWSYPSILFLAFMVPLPFSLANSLSGPLQRLATICSTFFMQTLGMPALSEGNIILLNDHEIGVVEACNGLRMLVVFFALATAMVLVIRRSWIDKAIIIASAVPIALVSNITRITATGLLLETTSSETAHAFFHDLAGWFMMPLALALLYVEMHLLAWIIVEDPNAVRAVRPAATTRRATPRAPRSQRRPAAAPTSRRPNSETVTEAPPTEVASLTPESSEANPTL